MYNILIVDDMEFVRKQIRELSIWKSQNEFKITNEAKCGIDALKILEISHIDLVITDIKMPGMDGIMLLKTIKQQNLADAVVLLSDYAEYTYAKQGLLYGAFDYMGKPVDKEIFTELLQRTKSYLDEKNRNKEKMERLVRMALDNVHNYYPRCKIAQITIYINRGMENVTEEVLTMISETRMALDDDFNKVTLVMRHSVQEIVTQVFEQNPWLQQFISEQRLLELNTSEQHNWQSLTDMSVLTVKILLDCMRNLALRQVENLTIQRLSEYTITHLDEELSLEYLSEKLFISKTYLSELFKDKTGVVITEYLTRVKMVKAKNIMLQKKLKTKEVAALLGYKDFTYFSKLYKKYWGVTPVNSVKEEDRKDEV